MKTVNGNGINMAYLEAGAGNGKLVILLHGFPDTAHTWDNITPRLTAAGYHTVAPFLRGYAPTSLPPGDTTIETLGRDVLALINALGTDHAILVGHDWGATAAYAAAAFDPAHIDKLVTLAIPHPLALFKHPDIPFSPHFMELRQPDALQIVQKDDFKYLDDLVVRWSPTWKVPARELDAVKNAFLVDGSLNAALGYYRAVGAQLPMELVKPLPMPALTFYGTEDKATSTIPFLDQKLAFTGQFELAPLPTGHFVHREAEEAFVTKLLQFLAQK